MTEQLSRTVTHKKKILVLLLILCSISAWIILSYESQSYLPGPQQLSEVDSLILSELKLYNIPVAGITQRKVTVNESFTRVHYDIAVPRGLSRTWIHSEIARKLHPANIRTFATVTFPERDIDVSVVSGNTMIRSLTLRQDTAAVRPLQLAHLLFYFDQRPDPTVIRELNRFGEPAAIVIRARSPQQAQRWFDALPEDERDVHFWIISDDYSYPGTSFNAEEFIITGNALKSIRRNPSLLYFAPADNRPSLDFFIRLRDDRIRIIRARNVHLMSDRNGRFVFDQEFRNFAQSAIRGERPMAIIRLTGQTLTWIEVHLTDLKKGGVFISPANPE